MLLTVFYTLINYHNLPPFIPIFNQLPWGNDRLTSTLGIFIPTIVFAIVFFFNIIFTSLVYSKNPLIARIVAAVTLILAFMNFLFIIRTITQYHLMYNFNFITILPLLFAFLVTVIATPLSLFFLKNLNC